MEKFKFRLSHGEFKEYNFHEFENEHEYIIDVHFIRNNVSIIVHELSAEFLYNKKFVQGKKYNLSTIFKAFYQTVEKDCFVLTDFNITYRTDSIGEKSQIIFKYQNVCTIEIKTNCIKFKENRLKISNKQLSIKEIFESFNLK